MGKSKRSRNLSRRDFLSKTAKGTVSVIGLSALGSQLTKAYPGESYRDPSRVVIIEDGNAESGSWDVNQSVAQDMTDEGIKRLTDICDVGEAWKSLFPGITLNSVICIKVNCINSSLSSHPEVAYCIINGLTSMMFGTTPFPENNIIIWDRTSGELSSAGYSTNTGSNGVRCYGTQSYTTQNYNVNGSNQKISTILTDEADYMINLAVLKNHGGPGTTLCLKNHYGTVNNPNGIHGSPYVCNPYIAALNVHTPITDKQVINIIDAIFGIISGGPGGYPQVKPYKIIMSTDAVAADTIGTEILSDEGTSSSSYNKARDYLETASGSPYNLGNSDLANIEQIEITDPSSNSSPSVSISSPSGGSSFDEGTDVDVTVNAGDPDGSILRVDMFLNGVLHESFTSTPFETTLSGLAIGDYIIHAHAIDNEGILSCSSEIDFEITESTGDMEEFMPGQYKDSNLSIFNNYPNPVKDSTTLSYQLYKPADVQIKICNFMGELIETLEDRHKETGYYRIRWDVANSVPTGLYLARFEIGDVRRTVKMLVVK